MRIDVLRRLSNLAIIAGPFAAIIFYFALPFEYTIPNGDLVALSGTARATLAMAVWMAVWWLTEAVPVPVTALLPIVAFPLLGLGSVRQVTTPYAHPLIFLFLGGFLLAIAIEKWGLHRWIAERVVRVTGGDAYHLVGGFMGITAFSSMWLSNTATTIMMLPIAISMVNQVDRTAPRDEARRFAPLSAAGNRLCGYDRRHGDPHRITAERIRGVLYRRLLRGKPRLSVVDVDGLTDRCRAPARDMVFVDAPHRPNTT